MTRELRAVQRAARARRNGEQAYRAALAAALAAGASLREVGEAAGVTKQAVRQILLHKTSTPKEGPQ